MTPWNKLEIARLYVALFGRAPDTEGLAFWGGLREAGTSLQDLANAMYATAPARQYFPEGASDTEVIAAFYWNVLGRRADAEGLKFWVQKLGAAGDKGLVIDEMVKVVWAYKGTNPDGIMSADFFSDKVNLANYYAQHYGGITAAAMVVQYQTSLNEMWRVIDQLGAHSPKLTLAGVGAIDLAGTGIQAISIQDVDGGRVRLSNLTGAAASDVTFAGKLDDLMLHTPDYTVGGGADTATVRLTPLQYYNRGAYVDKFEFQGVDVLNFVGTSYLIYNTAPLAVGHLIAPDLERIVLSGVDGFSVEIDDAPLLKEVDASGSVGADLRVIAAGNAGMNIIGSPTTTYDVISLDSGSVRFGGREELILFQNSTGVGRLDLTLNSAGLGKGNLTKATTSTVHIVGPEKGTVVTLDFGTALNNALTIGNKSLASANANVDLFSGFGPVPNNALNLFHFTDGSTVAAAASSFSIGDIDLIFDVNRDGWFNQFDDAAITLVGVAGQSYNLVFDAAADQTVLTFL